DSYDKAITFIEAITANSYNERNKSIMTGAKFPIQSIPVSGFGNFSDFNSWRTEFNKKINYDVQENQKDFLQTALLTDEQIDAWSQCKARENDGGIVARIIKWTDDIILWQLSP